MRRRTFCRWIATGVAAGAAGCLGTRAERGTGSIGVSGVAWDRGAWPTFGADAANTGVRPDGTGPDTGAVAWSAIGDAPTVLCSPTVADGTVFVGSARPAVHAFDAATGDRQWDHATGSYVETAPAVVGDTVYAADADGRVYALAAGDGTVRWTHDTGRNLHSRAVAVAGDVLVVGTAGTMPAVASGETDGTTAGVVVGLDRTTGEQRWTVSGPSHWFSGPAIGDGRVYVGNHSGVVLALDPATGQQVWRWRAPGDDDGHAAVMAPPAYRDGTVYVGLAGLGRLVALDAASGTPRWGRDLKAPTVKSSPAVAEDRVYVAAAGTEATDYDGPGEPTPTPTPTPGDDADPDAVEMPTVETSGSVFALNAGDGSIEWRYETGHDFRSSPAVVGDRVYVGGGDRVLALSRERGTEEWSVAFGDFVYSSPAVVDGRAYIGSADGSVYCIGDADG